MVKVKTALLSTFYKNGLEKLSSILHEQKVQIISTGGTLDWLKNLGLSVRPVEDLTHFPELLGGRVKTLHPKVFGGILNRRQEAEDQVQIAEFEIPEIDLVVVNLYPFQEMVAQGGTHQEIIEKIDIGGVSLIRAAAKNFQDVVIVADPSDYQPIADELTTNQGFISFETRKRLAAKAFQITAEYDAAIAGYFCQSVLDGQLPEKFIAGYSPKTNLRYGENPHQAAAFYGPLNDVVEQIHGKDLSYNNLVDIASGLELSREFAKNHPVTIILKHTNPCGVAVGETLSESYSKALACDPLSAFGGVIAMNKLVDEKTAGLLNELFFEVLMAPGFEPDALDILKSKKNRILLVDKGSRFSSLQIKSVFNGVLVQGKDEIIAKREDCRVVTEKLPTETDWENLLFANKIVKHTKSNTIVLAKNGVLLGSGTGQTSRVDALRQAIEKALKSGFDLKGCAMASDAFFPFPDCVEIAAQHGIASIIQPGGSLKDQDSISACNKLGISMVTTGLRHFKH